MSPDSARPANSASTAAAAALGDAEDKRKTLWRSTPRSSRSPWLPSSHVTAHCLATLGLQHTRTRQPHLSFSEVVCTGIHEITGDVQTTMDIKVSELACTVMHSLRSPLHELTVAIHQPSRIPVPLVAGAGTGSIV